MQTYFRTSGAAEYAASNVPDVTGGLFAPVTCMSGGKERSSMASGKKKVKNKYTFAIFKRELPLHLMILPSVIMLICFSYLPMGGIIIAFQKFIPSKGMFGNQEWIGLDNFKYVFSQSSYPILYLIRIFSSCIS